ncbi:GtrA family protein [Agathobacter sp.]|mgnify:FL=1
MSKIVSTIWKLIENAVRIILRVIYRLANKELSESTVDNFLQFIKFGIVGVSNTVISYILYAVCLMLLRSGNILSAVDYIIAQVVQFVLSVLWSFYWNNKFVFELKNGEKRSIWKSLIKTYISYSFTGLFLSSILLVLWVQVLGISEFIAPIINLLISVPLNFIINKFWAFKKSN